eukprot:6315284-Prymnesium_polylepis.1
MRPLQFRAFRSAERLVHRCIFFCQPGLPGPAAPVACPTSVLHSLERPRLARPPRLRTRNHAWPNPHYE